MNCPNTSSDKTCAGQDNKNLHMGAIRYHLQKQTRLTIDITDLHRVTAHTPLANSPLPLQLPTMTVIFVQLHNWNKQIAIFEIWNWTVEYLCDKHVAKKAYSSMALKFAPRFVCENAQHFQ